jgi:hypothetical protein
VRERNVLVMGGARQGRSDHVMIKGRVKQESENKDRETQFQMFLIAKLAIAMADLNLNCNSRDSDSESLRLGRDSQRPASCIGQPPLLCFSGLLLHSTAV